MFFTAVNPMYANQDPEEVQCDLDKPRICGVQNNWIIHKNTEYWCSLKLARRHGLQFYQTRSHAIALFNTHYLGFVVRNSQDYRASYLHQIRNVDVRILQIPKRENPPTITANKASGAGKTVAHFSRTHVVSI